MKTRRCWMLGALLLCTSCSGQPPKDDAMYSMIHQGDFSYQVVALDESSYYLWIKNQDLMFHYLFDTGDETGLSYYSMQISTSSDDPYEYTWVRSNQYGNQTLKKVKHPECDLLVDDAVGAFTSNVLCEGSYAKEAMAYETKIHQLMDQYDVSLSQAYSYGYSFIQKNRSIAKLNYQLVTVFGK